MDKLRSGIAAIGIGFVQNFRVSILLTIVILLFGGLSYTTFLKREGFPAVQFPLGLVQVSYFVNNAQQVDNEVATPIETTLEEIEAVNSIDTTITGNFVNFVVMFDESVSSQDGMKLVKNELERTTTLPESAKLEYIPINAGSIDGINDLVFTLSADNKSVADLQAKADLIAKEVRESTKIKAAQTQYLTTKEIDPLSGQEFEYQRAFKRYGQVENGKLVFHPAVSIGVQKDRNVGTLELSEEVRAAVERVQKTGALEGYNVSYGGDFADGLKAQIRSLENNALFGFLAVIIVLFVFINWRASIATAIFMPIVLAATFAGMYLIGYSLNVISLFALILVLGLFVDDAVVVTEAIDYQKRRGLKGIKAVSEGVKSVSIADVSGTLTTLLVFVPMATISGILGEFIVPLPVTVILAMAMSLLVALSLNVFYSNALLPEPDTEKRKRSLLDRIINAPNNITAGLGALIAKFVKFYLHGRYVLAKVVLVIITGLMLMGFGMYMATQLKFAIFPETKDAEDIIVTIDFPEGAEIATAETYATEVQNIITANSQGEIVSVDYYDSNAESATLFLKLTPMKERSLKAPELVKQLNTEFAAYKKAIVKSGVSSVGPPAEDYQYTMQVYADDPSQLRSATADVKQFIEGLELSNQEIKIEDVIVNNIEVIAKKDGKRYAAVKAKLTAGATTGDVVDLRDQVQAEYDTARLKALGLEEDAFGYNLGQESENLDSFNSAGAAMLIAIAVMYVLLLLQFNSFSKPLLVFLAIPFSFPGLFTGLYLTDNPFSFFVMIGMIGLAGIVVNNTIMLLDYADQARARGESHADAISQAVKLRFRPLMTTSTTTIAGMLPLALDDPFWEGLAFTMVFGLATSTLMVIFIFPAYYVALEKLRQQTKRGLRNLWRRLRRII